MSTDHSAVRVGQVWRSQDKRERGKTVEILTIDHHRVQVKGHVTRWLRVSTLRTRYTLQSDVSPSGYAGLSPYADLTPLGTLVDSLAYKRGWRFTLTANDAGAPALHIVSFTTDSYDHDKDIAVLHEFLVPPATYNRDTWAAWLFDRVRQVEDHEAGEFFMLDGVREFAPHHGNGEDPYRVWHASDYAATKVRAGEDG